MHVERLVELLLDPAIVRSVTLDVLILFIAFTRHVRHRLQWSISPTYMGPPPTLPPSILGFLSMALDLHQDTVEALWTQFADYIWDLPPVKLQDGSLEDVYGLLESFLVHGPQHELGFYDLFPPTQVCLDDACRLNGERRELVKLSSYKITMFSRRLGPLPSWCFSARCPHCSTRYYPSYYTHRSGQLRTYYVSLPPNIPNFIEVAMHYHVEAALADRFTNMAVCAWVSSTNNAKIYNLEMEECWEADLRVKLQDEWPYSFELSSEMALDALFLLGLLNDALERQAVLTLSQSAESQMERLRPALEERNQRMVGPGQEMWNHACDLCCEFNEGTQKALRAVVTDGIEMGHVRCRIHDCKEPLVSQRHHFCRLHAQRELFCAVKDCSAQAERPFKTCSYPTHRELENRGEESRTALFQLKRRLESRKASAPQDSFGVEGMPNADDHEVEQEECPDKPESGHSAGAVKARTTRLHALFGRSWTFCEEMCVGCCGMILGRATFYGSEAPNAVRLFHHVLFPTRNSVPGVMFYDNNCHVKEVIDNMGDRHFDGVALPVDVFHMKTKHKESRDSICNRHCNPANFPDLLVGKKWRFNSSAAEITNTWFGGFRSIVREMRKDRYNFFLDEMIKRRNRILFKDLKARAARPYFIPRSELLEQTRL